MSRASYVYWQALRRRQSVVLGQRAGRAERDVPICPPSGSILSRLAASRGCASARHWRAAHWPERARFRDSGAWAICRAAGVVAGGRAATWWRSRCALGVRARRPERPGAMRCIDVAALARVTRSATLRTLPRRVVNVEGFSREGTISRTPTRAETVVTLKRCTTTRRREAGQNRPRG